MLSFSDDGFHMLQENGLKGSLSNKYVWIDRYGTLQAYWCLGHETGQTETLWDNYKADCVSGQNSWDVHTPVEHFLLIMN